MNRRSFLQLSAAAAAAFALDPERALWTPGAKTIFLPPVKPITPVTGLSIPPGLFEIGDVITIAGKFARHPITGRETAQLQAFVVTADVDASSGILPLQAIWPRLVAADVPHPTRARPVRVGRTLASTTAITGPDGCWTAELRT